MGANKIAFSCEWINWFIQKMEYYSALKRNALSSHKKAWGNLKCILSSERRQFEKATYILYDSNSMTFWKRKNDGDGKKISGCHQFVGGWNK